MMYIPLWKRILTFIAVFLSLAYCMPNVVGGDSREWLAKNMPSWIPNKTISLGLDLQGGSYILLQADINGVVKQRLDDSLTSIRNDLRKQDIEIKTINTNENAVSIDVLAADKISDIKKIIRLVDPNFVITVDGSVVNATYDDAAMKVIRDQTMAQSIEIVNRRVNESGTKEPIIQRQGEDRVLVQLPGVNDPEQVKRLLGKTAKLTFHLVAMSDSESGVRKVAMRENPAEILPLIRRPLLTGDMLDTARPDFQEGMPVVSFRLNSIGARRFCEVTNSNVGKPFAVVLDNEIITAPRINEPICGGNAVISGTFTVQESSELAVLLRAGALPTTLTVVEERSVGPSLGNDSVDAGKIASIAAFILIVTFMIVSYGLFGIFASIALFINMIMIIALLSMIQATLTLPGIAGIILTMGMAVDANVLIFERIREEFRSGRSMISSMNTGFEKAMSSIIDSNLTTLIAGIILYVVGTGPIKGFAVTMSVGIITSMFSAILLTRIMLIIWMNKTKPKTIPL